MQEYTTNFYLQVSSSLLIWFTHYVHPKDTPYLQHRSKVLQHKLPIPKCSLSFICPLIIRLKPLSSSSFLGIIPSYLFLQWSTQLFCQVIGALEFINNELSSLRATNTKKIAYQKEPPCFLLHIASYAYIPPSILQTFFNAITSSTIHYTVQLLSSITQTNKIAYPCIPYSNDGYIIATRMQKGDD